MFWREAEKSQGSGREVQTTWGGHFLTFNQRLGNGAVTDTLPNTARVKG